MRLARGSGLDGLAAMPARRTLTEDGAVQLLRPLLGVAKARLVSTLEARDKCGSMTRATTCTPSNACVCARPGAPSRTSGSRAINWLSARNGWAGRGMLSTRRRMRSAMLWSSFTTASMPPSAATGCVWCRGTCACACSSSLLQAFGGSGGVARLVQVEALESALDSGDETTRTLGGCLVSQGSKTVRIFREPSGRDLPEIELGPSGGMHLGPAFRGEPRRRGDGQSGRVHGAARRSRSWRSRLCNLKAAPRLPAPVAARGVPAGNLVGWQACRGAGPHLAAGRPYRG